MSNILYVFDVVMTHIALLQTFQPLFHYMTVRHFGKYINSLSCRDLDKKIYITLMSVHSI